MLTFLRKLRRSLTGSLPGGASSREGGPIRRYMLYAIGEIALVVIGILIALQINNWNEWRKDRVLEKEVLSDLAENLESNVIELERVLERLESHIASKNEVIIAVENKEPYTDSLGYHMLMSAVALPNATLSYSGYEMLKNHGFDIVTEKSLRKEIVELFEFSYQELEKREIHPDAMILMEDLTRYYRRFFKLLYNPFRRIPLDYQALRNDNYFIEAMKSLVTYSGYLKELIEGTLSKTRKVMQFIEEELQIVQ